MVAFQTLGHLSEYLGDRDPASSLVEVADPGYSLLDGPTINAEVVLENQPSIRKVTGFIARNVASIPLHLYERIDDNNRARITDHVLSAPLREPRHKQTPYRFCV